MSDLVKRARDDLAKHLRDCQKIWAVNLFGEAADRIEELEAEQSGWANASHNQQIKMGSAMLEVEQLKARIVELEAALQKVTNINADQAIMIFRIENRRQNENHDSNMQIAELQAAIRDCERRAMVESASICDAIADGHDVFNGSCRGAIRMVSRALRDRANKPQEKTP